MKVLKQFLAVSLSLCVATPGWAQTAGNDPELPSNTPSASAPVVPANGAEYVAAANAYQTECSKQRAATVKSCDSILAAVSARAALVGQFAELHKDKKSLVSTLEAEGINVKKLQGEILNGRVTCTEKIDKCVSACHEGKVPQFAIPASDLAFTNAKMSYDSSIAFSKEQSPKCPLSNDPEQKAYQAKFDSSLLTTQVAHNSMKKGMSALLAGGLGLAAGAGAVMLLKGGGKKDKDEDTKAAADKAANGVIKDANGNEITCFSPEAYTKAECKSTLISLCQGSKGDTAGCRAFEAAYCANEGSGSGYCLYAEAKVYCAQSGDMIASSPACGWKSSRPSACTSSPEDVSCLVSGTPESLTLSCANYPNDPLCKANASGRVVVQGGSKVDTGDGASGTAPVTTTASRLGTSSMSSMIGGGSTSTLSAQNTGAKLQVIAGDNMWSNSTSALQKACASGQLLNCL